jgi:hypothetical protein
MASNLKFVYAITLFIISLFLNATNDFGKQFCDAIKFPFFFLSSSYTIFYLFLVTVSYSLYWLITGFERSKCTSDINCPKTTVSMYPFRWKCIENNCELVRSIPMNVWVLEPRNYTNITLLFFNTIIVFFFINFC